MSEENDITDLIEELDSDTATIIDDSSTIATQELPSTLYILPLAERPFFPAQTQPLLMNEKPWLDTVRKIGDSSQQLVGLAMTRDHEGHFPTPDEFYNIGTVARMHHPMRSDEKIQFIAEGVKRFKVTKWLSKKPPYLVQVEYPEEVQTGKENEMKAYAMAIINTIKELLPLNPLYSEELKFFLDRFGPNDPSPLTDFAASLTTAKKANLQEIMEAFDIRTRMTKVLVLIKKELDVAKLQSKIREQVEDKIQDHQRTFFLKEQLKTIQQELGISKDDRTSDLDRFKERIEKIKLTEAANKKVEEELEKLEMLESGSPEYAVTRNYLDNITNLPWGIFSEDKLDLDHAREILDRDHCGLDDVKDRIIEFLAIGALKGEVNGSIVLLSGPPGVGKTSIGRSIAEALGRKFYRFSVGGMRDEAEIKGHRRTYIGAMPGKFIQAIKECETQNPVIMLDEVDKIGDSYRGDPASALLEVLDPEQNTDFLDHYLDIRFDLSKVLFICTANQLDTIPSPLYDRMENIALSGYITREKVDIAKKHLLPKQLKKSGIKRGKINVSEPAMRHIIDGYARESGVRSLEKQLGKIIRKTAVKMVKGEKGPFKLGIKDIESYLGQKKFYSDKPDSGVGIVTGLAWTAYGGETLTIESSRVHTKNRGFKLTGQLGEVMQESAEIAYSYATSHLQQFGADLEFFDEAFVHIHVPAGATPKDGPSAGITMATALISLALNKRIKRTLAMTGELTLAGRVLAIGGLREKVIAARRQKIHELIVPFENESDYKELPDYLKEGMTLHFVKKYQEVFDIIYAVE